MGCDANFFFSLPLTSAFSLQNSAFFLLPALAQPGKDEDTSHG
jgi:hypothetical protein